jgi:hypothetical protein
VTDSQKKIPKFEFELSSTPIKAEPRKLKSGWHRAAAFDLINGPTITPLQRLAEEIFPEDAPERPKGLVELVAEEMTKEIDADIIRTLRDAGASSLLP